MTRKPGQFPRSGEMEGRMPFCVRNVLRCGITAKKADSRGGGALNSPFSVTKPLLERLFASCNKCVMSPSVWRLSFHHKGFAVTLRVFMRGA